MNYNYIKTGMGKMSIGALLLFWGTVKSKMTGNANFPTPDPTLAACQALADQLFELYHKVLKGDRDLIPDRDAKKREFKLMLDKLAGNIQDDSDGDASKILSSGFGIKGLPGTAIVPDAPNKLVVENTTTSGKALARNSRPANAAYFIYQICESDPMVEANWTTVGQPTQARMEITGLDSAKYYFVRVCAVGAAGQSMWSANVKFLAA